MRRNQVDGVIHQVEVLPNSKALAIGTKVFTAPPNELWDYRYRWSQFESLEYDPTTWNDVDELTWEDFNLTNTF